MLLEKLNDSCPHLHIVITSRKHLFTINDLFEPDHMNVPGLKGTKSVELFLSKAERYRSIGTEELIEFIKVDEKFDFKTFSKNKIQSLSTP